MKSNDLIDIIGESNDEHIWDAKSHKKSKMPRWSKWVAAAACFCLVAVGAWNTLDRLDYNLFEATCGSYPGIIVGDTYYYYVPHRGVMSYVPGGESELELHTWWFEEWQVNDYGIYFWQGLSVYVQEHGSGERRLLHSADRSECTHIRFSLCEDGNVVFIGYNKNTRLRYELLLDGMTGEVLKTAMEPTGYDDFEIAYSEAYLSIGSRDFVLKETERDERFELAENGVNLLPDGAFVSRYGTEYWGDALWLSIWYEDAEKRNDGETPYIILYPDGKTELVTLPNKYYGGGSTEYLFFPEENSELWCVEVATGETWALKMDAEGDFHDLCADGGYIYTTAPWNAPHSCWEVVYDGTGRPIAATMVTEDIATE